MKPLPPLSQLTIALHVLLIEGFDRNPEAEHLQIGVRFLAERAHLPCESAQGLIAAYPERIRAGIPAKYEIEILNDEQVVIARAMRAVTP